MDEKKNKILILSQANYEGTTDQVLKWMDHYRLPYRRLNGEDIFSMNELADLPSDSNTAAVWFRRKISAYKGLDFELKEEHVENHHTLRKFISAEFNALYDFLLHRIDSKKWMNNPFTEQKLNKLDVLFRAQKLGIQIPFTEMVNRKDRIVHYLKTYDKLIVKPFSEVIFLQGPDHGYYKMLSKILDKKTIKDAPETFFPSLIQEYIPKKMEIRSFYFYGKFYSMAILSQNNKNTAVDFRNYDNVRPNRTVPFQVPKDLEEKLARLMQDLQLNTGSIDLIFTESGSYYFLEINPVGQFGMVSYPCNYYLEKELALQFKKQLENER